MVLCNRGFAKEETKRKKGRTVVEPSREDSDPRWNLENWTGLVERGRISDGCARRNSVHFTDRGDRKF